MPNFYYKATDPNGRWLTGEIEGSDRGEATRLLRDRGLDVESLEEAELPAPMVGPGTSRAELTELVDQLAALTRSGLPLPAGLRAAGLEVGSTSLRLTFFEIADLVESGGRLDQALDRAGRRFPADLRGVISAGSRSGRLPEMLAEYVRGANLRAELRRMFTMKLAYPGLVFLFMIVLIGFLCTLATRASEALGVTMKDFGVDQPSLGRAMGALAASINEHGVEILTILVGLVVLAWITLRFGYKAPSRRRILCSIPVVGPVMRFSALTGFCHLLAMLIEADMPLPQAFELAGSCAGDADVAEGCARMGQAIEHGEPLSAATRFWATLPAGLGQLFLWSSDQDRLPSALHLAGDMFESKARSQSNYASNVLATVMFMLILWWVGFAIAAIYMPLLSLITLISKLSG